jgi:hypothetical protein
MTPTFFCGSETRVKENKRVSRSQAAEMKFLGIKLIFRMTIYHRDKRIHSEEVAESALNGMSNNRLDTKQSGAQKWKDQFEDALS